jgi:hypothetical protein
LKQATTGAIMPPVSHAALAGLASVGLMVSMLVLMEAGRRIGRRRTSTDPDGGSAGAGAVSAAVFALLGLLVAFTFSGAAARFDSRRQYVVEEANDVGTAWLRLDLLPEAAQPPLRALFRAYLDSRLETYRLVPDMAAVEAELGRSAALQSEIWAQAVAGCAAKGDPGTTTLVLPALNAMFDITTTRTMAARLHPPGVVFGLLFALALACALLAGFGMAGSPHPEWLHMVAFAVVLALCVYVILDFEYPRIGFIRVDDFDQVLRDVRRSMQ